MDFGTPLRTFFKKLTGLPWDPDIQLRLQKTSAKAKTKIWVVKFFMKNFQPIRIERFLKKSQRKNYENGALKLVIENANRTIGDMSNNVIGEILINVFIRKLFKFPYFGCATKSDF